MLSRLLLILSVIPLSSAFATTPLSVRSRVLPVSPTAPSSFGTPLPQSRSKQLALLPRGGGIGLPTLASVTATPQSLFNASLIALALVATLAKTAQSAEQKQSSSSSSSKSKSAQVRQLQNKFLPVFWLIKCADWLQGPYFYAVYASKLFADGSVATPAIISRLFLSGFASTALFGPAVGRAADQYGRKRATVAFTLIYAAGALSTQSTLLSILFAGRILSGIGTSLLFSAPEAWLVGEAANNGVEESLGETFGLAYAGDAIVAIVAGQMAALAATARGPTGPFELSSVFLVASGLLATFLWKENKANSSTSSSSSSNQNQAPTIREAIQVVRKDPKIMYVGGVQSLFEAAMYIFVLQWPPALGAAIQSFFGKSVATPFGAIFSCFMTCCLLGSTLFSSQAQKQDYSVEKFATGMVATATVAMTAAAAMTGSVGTAALGGLMASFFAFEACVGMYFPSIGTLRSKYVPDSHRSVIMNLFGIPLNILVVSVFLSIEKLGVQGALSVSSLALGLATVCMVQLRRAVRKEEAVYS